MAGKGVGKPKDVLNPKRQKDASKGRRRKFARFTGPRGIPTIVYEVQGGVRAFRKLMRRRWRRAKKIASVLIGRHQVPITPLHNPVTKWTSFHIIKLVDKSKAGHSVDLLVMDCNIYLVAFRRQLLGRDGKWSGNKWYKYSDVKDEELPPEISKHAVNLSFNSSHKDGSYATPGGVPVMHHMFEILSTFEDCERTRAGKLLHEEDAQRVADALLKAIVIFCETLRFRSIYLMMLQRALDGKMSSTLDPASWKLIHDWGRGSGEVQYMWKEDLPPMHTVLPEWFHDIKVSRPGAPPLNLRILGDLIGEEGELMLINAEPSVILTAKERAKLEKELLKNTSEPILEPGFD